jgi:hypothetical protein
VDILFANRVRAFLPFQDKFIPRRSSVSEIFLSQYEFVGRLSKRGCFGAGSHLVLAAVLVSASDLRASLFGSAQCRVASNVCFRARFAVGVAIRTNNALSLDLVSAALLSVLCCRLHPCLLQTDVILACLRAIVLSKHVARRCCFLLVAPASPLLRCSDCRSPPCSGSQWSAWISTSPT